MNFYLIVFDRPEGRILRMDTFADSKAALHERFHEEREHAGNGNIEVVVLGAESEEILHRTHARYFKSVSQLATDGMRLISEERAAWEASLPRAEQASRCV